MNRRSNDPDRSQRSRKIHSRKRLRNLAPHLMAYTVAAGAGIVTSEQPVKAEVTITDTPDVWLKNDSVDLDLKDDGIIEFLISPVGRGLSITPTGDGRIEGGV